MLLRASLAGPSIDDALDEDSADEGSSSFSKRSGDLPRVARKFPGGIAGLTGSDSTTGRAGRSEDDDALGSEDEIRKKSAAALADAQAAVEDQIRQAMAALMEPLSLETGGEISGAHAPRVEAPGKRLGSACPPRAAHRCHTAPLRRTLTMRATCVCSLNVLRCAAELNKRLLETTERIGRGVTSATKDFSRSCVDLARAQLKAAQRGFQSKLEQNRRASKMTVANRERELEGSFKQTLSSKMAEMADGGGLSDALKRIEELTEEKAALQLRVCTRFKGPACLHAPVCCCSLCLCHLSHGHIAWTYPRIQSANSTANSATGPATCD